MTFDANGSPVDDYAEAVAWLHSVSGFRHEPWPSEIRRCARLALQFFNGDLAKVKEFFPVERRINSADVQSAILYFERQIEPPPPIPESLPDKREYYRCGACGRGFTDNVGHIHDCEPREEES